MIEITDHELDVFDFDSDTEIVRFNGIIWMNIEDEYSVNVSGTYCNDYGTSLDIDYVTNQYTGEEFNSFEDTEIDLTDEIINEIIHEIDFSLHSDLQDYIDECNEVTYDDWDDEDEQEWNELQYGGEMEEDDE